MIILEESINLFIIPINSKVCLFYLRCKTTSSFLWKRNTVVFYCWVFHITTWSWSICLWKDTKIYLSYCQNMPLHKLYQFFCRKNEQLWYMHLTCKIESLSIDKKNINAYCYTPSFFPLYIKINTIDTQHVKNNPHSLHHYSIDRSTVHPSIAWYCTVDRLPYFHMINRSHDLDVSCACLQYQNEQ